MSDGKKYLIGEVPTSDAPTIGELASWGDAMSADSTGSDVDHVFRNDLERRSVVIVQGSSSIVVNRSDFYLHFSGSLGYGRALLAGRRIDR